MTGITGEHLIDGGKRPKSKNDNGNGIKGKERMAIVAMTEVAITMAEGEKKE